MMSVLDCRNQLGSDENAEAMRRGFRLALYLAQYDFPLVQTAIGRANQKKGTDSKLEKIQVRNEKIVADYRRLLAEGFDSPKIASRLAKQHDLAARTIREIIKPFR